MKIGHYVKIDLMPNSMDELCKLGKQLFHVNVRGHGDRVDIIALLCGRVGRSQDGYVFVCDSFEGGSRLSQMADEDYTRFVAYVNFVSDE